LYKGVYQRGGVSNDNSWNISFIAVLKKM
jgi:hypothetical protein